VGLAAGRDLVYALTGDGALVALDGTAAQPRWRRTDIGDTIGRPAEALDVVAVADRAGHVSLFSVTDGSPKGRKDAGAEPRDGLRAFGDRIGATLLDGRLWFYDPAKDAVIVDTRLDGTARLPLAATGDGLIVAPASGNGIAAFPIPK
jgi:outer membrane protein assembly factor BamB